MMTGPSVPSGDIFSPMREWLQPVFLAFLLITESNNAEAGLRRHEPVVLVGDSLPEFVGSAPSTLVGFGWQDGWVQIPVQVDERAVVDFGKIYNSAPKGQSILTYTDPGTFTGPDPDRTFDGDDELVFMAWGAGSAAPSGTSAPAGALEATRRDVRIQDPLTGATGFVYLFRSDGSLDQSAGAAPIAYDFVLLSGAYKATYDTRSGPNPEDSTVTTPAYSVHFSDRWIRNRTSVTIGGASGVDLLDRHKFLFSPGDCTRSEKTFSEGEGAFIVNRTGPVRALRGYVGANSGPTTYRIHWFYEEREEILSALRVHPIPGLMDYFDYSPLAAGMRYFDDLNPAGVTVDGEPDPVAAGPFSWEMITGAQGTLAHTFRIATDIPNFSYTLYYSDDTTPPYQQCTGDAYEYGASGFQDENPVPNTDPSQQPVFIAEVTRLIRYGPPNEPASFASDFAQEVAHPLVVSRSASPCPDADGDLYAACAGSCTPPGGTVCGDCDDADATAHPGATEICNGVDDDCDGTVDNPTRLDSDGDGVDSGCDNCPAVANPGLEDFDGNGLGDACDPALAITTPLAGVTLDCRPGAPPPLIQWLPGVFDRYRVVISPDPAFAGALVTSGDTWLRAASWTVQPAKWRKVCARTAGPVFIRVDGVNRDVPKSDPGRKASSTVIEVGTLN